MFVLRESKSLPIMWKLFWCEQPRGNQLGVGGRRVIALSVGEGKDTAVQNVSGHERERGKKARPRVRSRGTV